MLKYRLISAFVLIPVVIAALFLLPPMGFAIVTLVVCMLAAWEWGQLSGFTSTSQRVWLAVLCGLLLAAMLFLLPEYHYDVHQPMVEGSLWASFAWWIVALLLVLSYPASAAFWRHSKVLRLIFGILTIVPFFWGMLALRAWHYTDNHYSGAVWLLYVMILVWGADSGAYMFGKMFGKHKLAPRTSPKKSWEGFIAGLVGSAAFWCLMTLIPGVTMSIPQAMAFGLISGLMGVLGDLAESRIKRNSGFKDSGTIMPGHGGLLDRCDSLFLVAVTSAILLLGFGCIPFPVPLI